MAAFVGDGPGAVSLRSRAATLRLEARVFWCGRLEGAAALLSAVDAFVLRLRAEGTPIVLHEAMAFGEPVIVTRFGSEPDVSDAETVLVASDDSDGVSHALLWVLSDSVWSTAPVSAAHARLERGFARGPWLARCEALCRDMTRARRARAAPAEPGGG